MYDTLRTLVLSVSLLSIYTAAVKPGVPNIKWGENKYAFVELNSEATSYNALIKRVHDAVAVTVAWDVYTGDPASRAFLLFDDEIVKTATADELARRQIDYDCRRGGKHKAQIKLCNVDGCSASVKIDVTIADTDGSHLERVPHVWYDNNVPYRKTTNKVVAAYFVEWGVYGKNYPADKIPVPNLTHLLYGFIPICGGEGINDSLKQVSGSFEALQRSCAGRENFKVTIHDIWGALQKPQKGVTAWNEPYKGNFGQLMAIKRHNPDIKILPSIGGWTLSDPFFFLNDARKRKTFVDSVGEFLRTWKFFDGVDIDWEFPGGKGANGDLGNAEIDSETYVSLLKELRDMLDELQSETGRVYQLTTAISAGYDKIDVVDYRRAQKYLDNIFVMNYDFKGAWSNSDLGHQTPLHAPAWDSNEKYTTDFGITRLLNQGVDSNKLVVGVAMYGRGWSGVSNYTNNNPFSGIAVAPVKGSWEDGVVDYKDITNKYPVEMYYYDEIAAAAYVFNDKTGDLISYDSEKSVLAKGKYVREKNLGGLFAWELDADNGDLLNAMNEGVGNEKTLSVAPAESSCPVLPSFLNRFRAPLNHNNNNDDDYMANGYDEYEQLSEKKIEQKRLRFDISKYYKLLKYACMFINY
ncbi:chitinase [Malacosoma neustria nucleopolyhedrovirus]|uniref:chitinase n=1 Tax=Malacosoma neustria nuclear polyhedrosis virus TaxID=38012 RepID=UPI000E35E092|nr:chitinase [Malacosoma neustria nucleopolyhedrovirus]AUF81645.1 chitinase [Malacosoma neustria nucleopolyhedrovirus]